MIHKNINFGIVVENRKLQILNKNLLICYPEKILF